ncbi:MAG: hypothetical protein GX220_00450 [Treponema sp.]|nr:hypothetical protein [Treponema sp.]
MDKKASKRIIFINILVILIIIFSIFAMRPMYNRLTAELNKITNNLLNLITEKTGIILEYEKISPAVLINLKIYNINAIDEKTLEKIASINKISVNYNLLNVFSGQLDKIIGSITLDKVFLTYDVLKNENFTKKILPILKQNSTENTEEVKKKLDLINVNIQLPFEINVKKLNIKFSNDYFSTESEFKKISVKQDEKNQRIYIKANGNTKYIPLKKSVNFGGITIANFSLSANIFEKLKDSVVQIKLSKFNNKVFEVVPLQLVLRYNEDSVSASILQSVQNVSINLIYDLNYNFADVYFNADSFEPFKIAKIKDKKNMLTDLNFSKIDGRLNAKINVENFNANYESNLVFTLPKKFLGGTIIETKFYGNENTVNIKDLKIDSKILSANYEGSFNINKLQPQGTLNINKVSLSNGNSFETEVFFDPLDKGFMFFIPQVYFGEQFFSAIQAEIIPEKTSVDFSLELFDFTHLEFGEPGKLLVSGSLLKEKKQFVQSQLEIENFAIDAILSSVQFFLDNENGKNLTALKQFFLPFVMTTQMYVLSDFSQITYNVPYLVCANTQKDKEFALLSFDGNEFSFSITQCDGLFADQAFQVTLNADFSENYKDIIFSTNINFNSIPYEFYGMFNNFKNLSINGSYGLNAVVSFDKSIFGNFVFESFPIALSNYIFSASTECEFRFEDFNDWFFQFTKFEINETTNNFFTKPKLFISGKIEPFGAMFENIIFSDTISTVNGTGSVMWQFNNNILELVSTQLRFKNLLNKESYALNFEISNPEKMLFTDEKFINNIFFNANLTILEIPSARFLQNQPKENLVSGTISALGTLENPGVVVNISKSNFLINKDNFSIVGNVSLQDGIVSMDGVKVNYANHKISNTKLYLDLNNFSGLFQGDYVFDEQTSSLKSDFIMKIQNLMEFKQIKNFNLFDIQIPKEFKVDIELPLVQSEFWGNYKNVKCQFVRTENRLNFFGGKNSQVQGFYADNGECFLTLEKSLPFSFVASGKVTKDICDISVQDFILKTKTFARFIEQPSFKLVDGIVSGNLHIGGLIQDPEFSGNLMGNNIRFTSPDYMNEEVVARYVDFYAEKNIFGFDKTYIQNLKGEDVAFGSLALTFDRWFFDNIKIKITSIENKYIKAGFKLDFMNFEGDAAIDLGIEAGLTSVDVRGNIFVENVDGVFSPFYSTNTSAVISNDFQTVIDLKIMIGHRSQVFAPSKRSPIMRALVAPQTEIIVSMNTLENHFELKGDLVLRGGEVSYGNRNFYLREGRLVLNERADVFDPTITVHAETRERDADGELIRIILATKNQHFSNFIPVFSSIPARSEKEIMELLALSITDTMKNEKFLPSLLAIGGEMVIQMTLFKQMENSLRDFFKFDIFSLRTSILQNAMNSYLNVNSGNSQLTAGNFFDNSTVYIGKYFGNALYWDFMGHLTYNENKINDKSTLEGLEFQPEMGFEMASPFANFRWSLAPELGKSHRLWVPYTSISVSWKVQL